MPATHAEDALKANDDHFEESLASVPFLFVIGEEAKEFHIHKELVAQLSPALNALVNGSMKEAREGRVEWPDLDVNTFVRFAKYAYSRDYPEAAPDILTPPQPEQGLPDVADPEVTQDSAPQGIAPVVQQDGEDYSSEVEDEGVDEDDEAGSSSMSDESVDISSDEEDDDDDDEEGDDDEDDEDDEADEYDEGVDENEEPVGMPRQHIASSPTQVSSTISSSQAPTIHDFGKLPFSIMSYIECWEAHIHNLVFNQEPRVTDAGQPPVKRRMLNNGECRFASPANLKYEAMRRFIKLDIQHAQTRWSPRPNANQYECYSPVFLCHARLYILADKYGVEPLKALTLYRLHNALYRFVIYAARISDLADLIHVIYENTVGDDLARQMIVQFFCCIAEHAKDCAEFRAALRVQGEFADDLFQEMTSRLL